MHHTLTYTHIHRCITHSHTRIYIDTTFASRARESDAYHWPTPFHRCESTTTRGGSTKIFTYIHIAHTLYMHICEVYKHTCIHITRTHISQTRCAHQRPRIHTCYHYTCEVHTYMCIHVHFKCTHILRTSHRKGC